MRKYALIHRSILDDPNWRLLTQSQQNLYLLLLLQVSNNLCGVVDWRPKRLAVNAADMTPGSVSADASVLESRLYVVRDEDTEEVLIRSFLRNDAPLKSVKSAVAVRAGYSDTASEMLRGVIVFELRRLHVENPDWPGWGVVGDLLSLPAIDPRSFTPSDAPSDTPSDAPFPPYTIFPIPSSHCPRPVSAAHDENATEHPDNPTFIDAEIVSDHEPDDPAPALPKPTAPEEKNSGKRETPGRNVRQPLPDDWTPSHAHHEYADAHGLDCDAEAFKFRNWCEANGKRYVRFDSAFNRWLANAAEWSQDKPKTATPVMAKSMANDAWNADLQRRAAEWDRQHPDEQRIRVEDVR